MPSVHGKGKLLEITRGPQKPTQWITQQDLMELALLREKARSALDALRRKRTMIRAALESGAHVEPGSRCAALEVRLMVR